MISRRRRGNRPANMRARLGLAGAVLVGGSAIGVALAASSGGGAAGIETASFTHNLNQGQALYTALNQARRNPAAAMNTIAHMKAMPGAMTVRWGRTTLAAQRGTVVSVIPNVGIVVRTANNPNQVLLWTVTGQTLAINVTGNVAGMAALTGNNTATNLALRHNTGMATQLMGGGLAGINQMARTHANRTVTVTFTIGNTVIRLTITSAANVQANPFVHAQQLRAVRARTFTHGHWANTTRWMPVRNMPVRNMMATAPATLGVATPANMANIAMGDMVLVIGTQVHFTLNAQLILFATTTTMTPTTPPTTTAAATATTATSTATATTSATATGTKTATASPSVTTAGASASAGTSAGASVGVSGGASAGASAGS